VGRLQRTVGPHYARVRLTSYRRLAREVTESTFGDLVLVANWDSAGGYATGGYGIAPNGFLARTTVYRLVAGAFEETFGGVALSAGTHYLIVERDESNVTVRQPLGADTNVAVEPPPAWRAGRTLQATAIAPDGKAVGAAGGALRNGVFVLPYARELNGHPVAAYRIAVSA
jgi:hypothetical protein